MQSLPFRVMLAAAAALLLVAFIYWPGLAGPFVLDDIQNVVHPDLAAAEPAAILYNITHNGSGLLGRSVSMLSFVVSTLIHGEGPRGFKFDNLLLHLFNGLLIARLLFLCIPAMEPRLGKERVLLIAGAAATLWLAHPLLVSTVLYVVQRMTELASCFILLGLLAYLAARGEAGPSRRYLVAGWVLFPLCLVLAMLAKEIGVLLPVYVGAIELVVFRPSLAALRRNRALAAWLGTFVALPAVAGGLYVLTHFGDIADHSGRNFTLGQRLLSEAHAMFFYARLILLPRVSAMSVFRDDFPVTAGLDPLTLAMVAFICAMPAAIWYLRTRAPVLAFGLAWFFVSHLLESTFISLELVFEHRNYLAALGLLLPPVHYALAGAGFRQWGILVAVFGLLLGAQTFSRAREWSNEGLMLGLAVSDHPQSPRARVSYANYLMNQNEIDGALAQLQAAAALDPKDAGPDLHMLSLRCAGGTRDAALLDSAVAKLEQFPATVYALNAIENLFTLATPPRNTCTLITDEDFSRMIEAAMRQPRNLVEAETHGFLLRFRGVQRLKYGRYAEGVIAFREAFEVSGEGALLGELIAAQIAFGRLGDAQDTLAVLEAVDAERHGREGWLVTQQRKAVAEALAAQAGEADATPSGAADEEDATARVIPAGSATPLLP